MRVLPLRRVNVRLENNEEVKGEWTRRGSNSQPGENRLKNRNENKDFTVASVGAQRAFSLVYHGFIICS